MSQIFNFSAGPSVIPEPVLKQAREEMLDWRGTGISVMEMGHRSAEFISIAEKTEADFRSLMRVPENYRVLFLQGGASSQFSMVPMNLLNGKDSALYVCTGSWSKKAIVEARRICQVKLAASSELEHFNTIPPMAAWNIDSNAAYLHYTTNETIGGVEFQRVPVVDGLPLVADMSSNILSREIDVSRFGLIYAGAQKNMGPAGITVVIVREDLIETEIPKIPSMFEYRLHAKNQSMLNTPPTYNWYILGLVLEWIINEGGIAELEKRNILKAEKLYSAIDHASLYSNPVDPRYRSRMNIPFLLADKNLNKKFLIDAEKQGLIALKGHRSVGGMRASIYNAMPEKGVDTLIEFMKEFERNC